MVGVDWLNFAPSGDHLWQADYIGNYLVDIIMIPTFFGAVACFALGLKRFLGRHACQCPGRGQDRQGKNRSGRLHPGPDQDRADDPQTRKFTECTENRERSTAHMMVLFGFIGLFIVTNCFFAAEWIFHIEGPYRQINPVKWLGNHQRHRPGHRRHFLLLKNRLAKKDQISSYWDWYLVGLVLALGVTGMLTQMLRLGGMYDLSAFVYFLHLIFIWSLFAYTPFSKLAHIVYRTTAMAYQEYSGRK
jgi:quinone-modifying oxidoreductase subunit QmoC